MIWNIFSDCQYVFNPISGVTPSLNPRFTTPLNFDYKVRLKRRLENLNSDRSSDIFMYFYKKSFLEFHSLDYTVIRKYTFYHLDSKPSFYLTTPFMLSVKFFAIYYRFLIHQQTHEHFRYLWNSLDFRLYKYAYMIFKVSNLKHKHNKYTDWISFSYNSRLDLLRRIFTKNGEVISFFEPFGSIKLFKIKDFSIFTFKYKYK